MLKGFDESLNILRDLATIFIALKMLLKFYSLLVWFCDIFDEKIISLISLHSIVLKLKYAI